MGKSHSAIVAVIVFLSLVAPAALCAAAALVPVSSGSDLVGLWMAAAVWMALLAAANWWEFTSVRLTVAWPVALALTCALRLAAPTAVAGWRPGPVALSAALALVAGAWLLWNAWRARSHPGDAVELTLPFGAGRFLVTDGGDGARSFLVNYHYGFGRHRASGVSASMRYATDLVEIGPGGGESRGFIPRRNEAYRIWERPLLAPCDGEVVFARDEVEDNAAFGPNRPYGLGNHVVIRTGADVFVVLGHVRRGSVCVQPGQRVRAGEPIGTVGNSGWTERPHLHIQASRSGLGDYWHGEPVPMRFDGRFPVRNQVLRSARAGARVAHAGAPGQTTSAP